MITRTHILIHGDVTGVGFRAWTVRKAQDLGLTGWVRNLTDEIVELTAEGPKEKLEELIFLCRKGPEVSWVEKVEINWQNATGEFTDFTVRY